MADDPTEPSSEPTPEPVKEPDPLPENPPSANTPSTPQTVKVDLGELRDLIEGLPERTAQFIKEAVSTPKQTPKSTEKKTENAPEPTRQDTPKSPSKSKRGWLARGLFGD